MNPEHIEKNAKKVFAISVNQWDSIFANLASTELESAINKLNNSGKTHTHCPVHGGKNGDAFRLFRDFNQTGGGVCNSCGTFSNGISLMAFIKGLSYNDAAMLIAKDYHNILEDGKTITPVKRTKVISKPSEKEIKTTLEQERNLKKNINKIYKEAIPVLKSKPALDYFRNRDIYITKVNDIKYHPGITFQDAINGKKIKEQTPALVAVMRDFNNKPLTLHRTYIKDGEKAYGSKSKKLYSRFLGESKGAAIRLGNVTKNGLLGIAEGVESALAVTTATGTPVWAAYSTSMLKNFIPPSNVNTLFIWADNDRLVEQHGKKINPGMEAAKSLKAKLQDTHPDIYVEIMIPPKINEDESCDWNQILQVYGPDGFPF